MVDHVHAARWLPLESRQGNSAGRRATSADRREIVAAHLPIVDAVDLTAPRFGHERGFDDQILGLRECPTSP